MAIRWKVFKKVRGSKYVHYAKKVVIISSPTGFVLTPATMEILGNPLKVLLLHDGEGHLGIRPVKETDPEYGNAFKVTPPGGNGYKDRDTLATSVISCKGFIKALNVNEKAVFSTISIENDIMVVDMTKFEILKIQN